MVCKTSSSQKSVAYVRILLKGRVTIDLRLKMTAFAFVTVFGGLMLLWAFRKRR